MDTAVIEAVKDTKEMVETLRVKDHNLVEEAKPIQKRKKNKTESK